MIIKKLELVNYCQHGHREITIAGNLIAVVGRNGVGKSNMLGALQFALTGEQPDKNKADLLHWGAKEGHVVLEFEQDGKPGRIERSVSSNKVTLEYDGVTTSGITNVAKEIETRLHMDKDLIRQSVFVRQTEVDAIISAKTDKRDREVAFQKLLGIDAAKIHKNLTDWIYATTKPVAYDVQLAEANQRLGELETRVQAVEDEVRAAEKDLADFGEVDESGSVKFTKALAAVSAVLQARAGVQTCAGTVIAREKDLEWAREKAGLLGEDPGFDLVLLAEQAAVLRDELRKIGAKEAAEAEISGARQAYADAVAADHPSAEHVAALAAEADAVKAELSAVRAEQALRRKSLSSLDGTESTCPVCGRPLEANMVERLRAELASLGEDETRLAANLQAKHTEHVSAMGMAGTWQRAVDTQKARLDVATAELERLNADAPAIDRATAEAAMAENSKHQIAQRDYDAKAAEYKKAVGDAELRLSLANQAKADMEARLADAVAVAKKLCGDEAAADWEKAEKALESVVAEADRRRARRVDLQMAVTRASATRDEVLKSLEMLRKTVESLKAAQDEQDELAKRLHVAERVKDWFHYTNGPRVIVTYVLGRLTDNVNRFLGNFTAPFIVTPDPEQVGFRVQFTDGRDCPEDPPGTGVLSGGERVQLAVAFRLAIYAMFARKLGLLSLDEPTAYLDESNVDRFGVLLTKVREVARNMNAQVFMATHEQAVIPHMDSVISLD